MSTSGSCTASEPRPRVVLVNSNQVKPTIAPIAFDYLHEPLVPGPTRGWTKRWRS